MRADEDDDRFEQTIIPHLDAAYNLARWLTRDGHDAEDVVQEACLRARQFFGSFRGVDGRAWLLTIVRNTCYTWLERNRPSTPVAVFDEQLHGSANPNDGPMVQALRDENCRQLRQALERLPTEYREVVVLRELEGLSYKEISGVVGIPLGTVMSRLARARERLQQDLAGRANEEHRREL